MVRLFRCRRADDGGTNDASLNLNLLRIGRDVEPAAIWFVCVCTGFTARQRTRQPHDRPHPPFHPLSFSPLSGNTHEPTLLYIQSCVTVYIDHPSDQFCFGRLEHTQSNSHSNRMIATHTHGANPTTAVAVGRKDPPENHPKKNTLSGCASPLCWCMCVCVLCIRSTTRLAIGMAVRVRKRITYATISCDSRIRENWS